LTLKRVLEKKMKNKNESLFQIPAKKLPSYFFAPDTFLPINTDREPMTNIFKNSFLYSGRVSHLEQLIAWHPSFYQKFVDTNKYIMQAPGPVSLPWRNYIAILAVSKYRCDYLLRLQEEEFLLNQGDIQWIENPSIMPEKLKNWIPQIQY